MDKSDALRLADALDVVWAGGIAPEAAAELRRLHAQRDALLEALKALLNAESSYAWAGYSEEEIAARDKAFAAIEAAEEST